MNAKQQNPTKQTEDQRKALQESERTATRKHPQTFKDESTGDKMVEIGPDLQEDPIKGIDPAEPEKSGR